MLISIFKYRSEVGSIYIYIYIYIYVGVCVCTCVCVCVFVCVQWDCYEFVGAIIYIYIYRLTVSFYHNALLWLDTMDASSWDQNPPNFTLDRWHNTQPFGDLISAREFNAYVLTFVCLRFTQSDTGVPPYIVGVKNIYVC